MILHMQVQREVCVCRLYGDWGKMYSVRVCVCVCVCVLLLSKKKCKMIGRKYVLLLSKLRCIYVPVFADQRNACVCVCGRWGGGK